MAASVPLPVTQDLSTLRAKLQGLLRFLRQALPISNAHTVDFFTESVWDQLVGLPPETVLEELKRSTAETETPRPLVEADGGSGEWRVGGTERRREGPAREACPLVETGRNQVSRGGPGGLPLGPEVGIRLVEGWCEDAVPPSRFRAWVLVYFHNLRRTRNRQGCSFI